MVKSNCCDGSDKEGNGMRTKMRVKETSGRMRFIFLRPKMSNILFQPSCHHRGEGEANKVEANGLADTTRRRRAG